MRRFRALIKKEMIHMLRDPRTLIFIFLMPILQLVLLGYANSTEIKNVPTAPAISARLSRTPGHSSGTAAAS